MQNIGDVSIFWDENGWWLKIVAAIIVFAWVTALKKQRMIITGVVIFSAALVFFAAGGRRFDEQSFTTVSQNVGLALGTVLPYVWAAARNNEQLLWWLGGIIAAFYAANWLTGMGLSPKGLAFNFGLILIPYLMLGGTLPPTWRAAEHVLVQGVAGTEMVSRGLFAFIDHIQNARFGIAIVGMFLYTIVIKLLVKARGQVVS